MKIDKYIFVLFLFLLSGCSEPCNRPPEKVETATIHNIIGERVNKNIIIPGVYIVTIRDTLNILKINEKTNSN